MTRAKFAFMLVVQPSDNHTMALRVSLCKARATRCLGNRKHPDWIKRASTSWYRASEACEVLMVTMPSFTHASQSMAPSHNRVSPLK
jgi:hypothetical protein